ncbi:HIT family protein [Ramlibacter sp. AN1015]|uniref:HIT family protein n=1 Tax=Ramlibacter sp. AN1015 TaxID=3133428 RepID=UPI0030BF09EB
MPAPRSPCALCDADGGRLVLRTPTLRVVHAGEAAFPGFYRVVWHAHVAEFSDLSPADRSLCMEAVVQTEQALRAHLGPDKVNLASLGNMVAHLHWHVVARFAWDTHFPAPVWAAAVREAPADALADLAARLPALEAELRERLARL